ncbi:MAG: radical SAM protein [Clostridia bacterium]|nr:radical SAM protein [Clostridia bacterium]
MDFSTLRVSSGAASALGLLKIKSFAAPTTAYVMIGEHCARDCAFCSQARSSIDGNGRLSRVTWPEFRADEFAAALGKAASDGSMKRACAQVIGTATAFEDAVKAVHFLREASGGQVPVSVSFSAMSKLEHVAALVEAGADRVALPIDAANRRLYERVKGHDMAYAMSLISKCASTYPGHIGTHLIAGLGETEQDVASVASAMFSQGVGVGLFAFTPLPGTRLAYAPPPDLRSYRRIQLCLHLMKLGIASLEDFQFDSGRLVGIRLPADIVMGAALSGEAFMTSGCPDCNRPYYNERPGTVPYNYPLPLSGREAEEAASDAAADVRTDVGIGANSSIRSITGGSDE